MASSSSVRPISIPGFTNTSAASSQLPFFTPTLLPPTTMVPEGFGGGDRAAVDDMGDGSNSTTTTAAGIEMIRISWDDATWIMTCCFIIFTMQSGFGLLESGSVSAKNEVNIMVKNAIDVIFGGLSFWIFGFGIIFGDPVHSNPFMGVGNYLVDTHDVDLMGDLYTLFIFQLSFCTTATTIVSGAMAERTKLNSYVVFSFLNTFIYCFPAHWMWGNGGFLGMLGAIDIAGSGVVHLVGGLSGLIATMMLGPRKGRFVEGHACPMGSPTNAMLGTFLLWWGWLAFNCGSTYGISGGKWKLAARASVTTVMSAMGGGLIGIIYSFIFKKRKYSVPDLINGILGALVSVTAICAIAYAWEAVVIGMVGGILAVLTPHVLNWMKIDDPVGVVPVHCVCSVWGMLCVGLFVDEDKIQNMTRGRKGLFRGGSAYLLLVQALSVLTIAAWTILTSYLLLKVIDLALGLRMSEEEERLGADFVEHGLSCRLEFPDGSLFSSNEITIMGDSGKMSGMRVVKMNQFSGMYLKTLAESTAEVAPPNGTTETGTEVSQTSHTPSETRDGAANGDVQVSNGIHREVAVDCVRRTASNASSTSSQIRKREKVEGHSNPAFNGEENKEEHFF